MSIDEQSLAQTYQRLTEDSRLSVYSLVLMGLAGVLAAVALLTNSIPVLIGAMVVAPALSPLSLIALGLVINRPKVAVRALGVSVAGLLVAVLAAVLTTWLLNVAGVIAEGANLVGRELLEERVRPGWYSAVVALAAGCAGMLANVKNKTDTLVGSVAALALVPAGAAAGIALQSGDAARAAGGLLLLTINLVLIIAMGVLVLVLLGRGRPWRQGRSRRGNRDQHRECSPSPADGPARSSS